MLGSSPLARGLPSHTQNGVIPARIIPARAGFTVICAALRPLAEDHPRSRGVYISLTRRGRMK